jgi:hypothetical protein
LGYNTFVHGSKTRNLSVQLSLSQLAKPLCLIIAYVFSSTKLEIRAEQILPGSEGRGERRRGGGGGGKFGKTPSNWRVGSMICSFFPSVRRI